MEVKPPSARRAPAGCRRVPAGGWEQPSPGLEGLAEPLPGFTGSAPHFLLPSRPHPVRPRFLRRARSLPRWRRSQPGVTGPGAPARSGFPVCPLSPGDTGSPPAPAPACPAPRPLRSPRCTASWSQTRPPPQFQGGWRSRKVGAGGGRRRSRDFKEKLAGRPERTPTSTKCTGLRFWFQGRLRSPAPASASRWSSPGPPSCLSQPLPP